VRLDAGTEAAGLAVTAGGVATGQKMNARHRVERIDASGVPAGHNAAMESSSYCCRSGRQVAEDPCLANVLPTDAAGEVVLRTRGLLDGAPPIRALRRTITPERIAPPRTGSGTASIALTFDDGPNPAHTPELLDLLAAQGVAATFFLVGRNAVRYPELARRILAEGHAVGSHSMSHPDPWELRATELWDEYRGGHQAVADTIGEAVRLFRPPKGHVSRRDALLLRAARLQPVLWTIDPADWEAGLSAEDVLERVGEPAVGDIVLLHDGLEKPPSPGALDRSATIAAVRILLERSALAGGVRFRALI
jgi:peptidoglycan-N-acetylglucosamine deacetylase